MKAMILAAGLGTRLYPITQNTPKALVSINGKTLLEHTILKLKEAGFDELIINLHHFPDQIIDFVKSKNDFNIRIEFSDERTELLDTGGAIKKATSFFNDNKPFLVHNVDILSNINLQDVYNEHTKQKDRLTSLVVSQRDTFRYLLFDDNMSLCGWTNTKTKEIKPNANMNIDLYEKYAFSGIQIISPTIFDLMEKEENRFPMMPFYLKHCTKQKIVGYVPDNLKLLDVGKIDVLKDADTFLKEL